MQRRYAGKPFTVLGVNGDRITEFDRKRFEKDPLPWKSFQDVRPDRPSISDEWKVRSWPTLFLVDHEGVIRRRWVGPPPPDELDAEVDRLVKQVKERKAVSGDPATRTSGSGTPVK